jgi:hypothetical protein
MKTSRMIQRPLSTLLLLAAIAQPLLAQTLELRTGEVVIGRVLEVDADTISVEVTFPTVSERITPRSELGPRSIYALLSARMDQADAKGAPGIGSYLSKARPVCSCHRHGIEFETRRRECTRGVIPPVGEQNAPDVEKQAGDGQ